MTVEGHIDVRELAGRLARRRRGRTEATVQADVRMLLLASGLNLTEGDVLDVELEAQLGDRRREGPQEAHPWASLRSAPILIRLEEALQTTSGVRSPTSERAGGNGDRLAAVLRLGSSGSLGRLFLLGYDSLVDASG